MSEDNKKLFDAIGNTLDTMSKLLMVQDEQIRRMERKLMLIEAKMTDMELDIDDIYNKLDNTIQFSRQ